MSQRRAQKDDSLYLNFIRYLTQYTSNGYMDYQTSIITYHSQRDLKYLNFLFVWTIPLNSLHIANLKVGSPWESRIISEQLFFGYFKTRPRYITYNRSHKTKILSFARSFNLLLLTFFPPWSNRIETERFFNPPLSNIEDHVEILSLYRISVS